VNATKAESPALTRRSLSARFHFDVCTDGVTVRDEDGIDLLSPEAARLEAARAAAEMVRDRTILGADPANVTIVVRDGSPEAVCQVTVALTTAGKC
jgi:hypothetical protein